MTVMGLVVESYIHSEYTKSYIKSISCNANFENLITSICLQYSVARLFNNTLLRIVTELMCFLKVLMTCLSWANSSPNHDSPDLQSQPPCHTSFLSLTLSLHFYKRGQKVFLGFCGVKYVLSEERRAYTHGSIAVHEQSGGGGGVGWVPSK